MMHVLVATNVVSENTCTTDGNTITNHMEPLDRKILRFLCKKGFYDLDVEHFEGAIEAASVGIF